MPVNDRFRKSRLVIDSVFTAFPSISKSSYLSRVIKTLLKVVVLRQYYFHISQNLHSCHSDRKAHVFRRMTQVESDTTAHEVVIYLVIGNRFQVSFDIEQPF